MDFGCRVGHDGMAAFPGPNGKTILVRNHELTATAKTAGVPLAGITKRLNLLLLTNSMTLDRANYRASVGRRR